jgi:hypothetical protein
MKKNLRGKYKLKPNERKDDFTQDRVVKFLNTISNYCQKQIQSLVPSSCL